MRPDLQDLFRMEKLPHIWCPGCGHGIVTGLSPKQLKNPV